MGCSTYRPEGYVGEGDSRLPQIAQQLRRVLSNSQRDFAHDSLRLSHDALGQLAGILVDFAEDLHNDIGIWAAYERYNVDFFGTALPLTPGTSGGDPVTGLHPERLCHLLWVLYPAFIEGLTLSPTHQDLQRISAVAHASLNDGFQSVPKDCSVKAFRQASNGYGWDVKRKLVWLGCRSYMFRAFFANYDQRQLESAPNDN